MTAGERIYKCRKAKKLSQEYVATILGVSRQAVSKWENDLSVPDTVNYINLAKIFGVSVEYLAFGEGDGPSGEKISVLTEELVPQKEADEPEEEEKEKPVIMIFIGLLLFFIGVVVILFSILFIESFFLFMIGVLAIVLAKKAVLD
jgi:transcriptional regulator with XRE-family HTH domain